MNSRWIFVSAALFSLFLTGPAEAEGPGRSVRAELGKAGRVHSTPGLHQTPVRWGSDARRDGSRPEGGLSRVRGGGRGLEGLRSGNVDLTGASGAGLMEQLLYNAYGDHHIDPYAGEKAQAKAYRDAAIANAIANVVVILATANRPQAPVAICPPPAPPLGHIERQQVLVQEGRTEEYDVWVPEYTIPATGEVVVGHHETRRRTIAPVYEEREIWVPSP